MRKPSPASFCSGAACGKSRVANVQGAQNNSPVSRGCFGPNSTILGEQSNGGGGSVTFGAAHKRHEGADAQPPIVQRTCTHSQKATGLAHNGGAAVRWSNRTNRHMTARHLPQVSSLGNRLYFGSILRMDTWYANIQKPHPTGRVITVAGES